MKGRKGGEDGGDQKTKPTERGRRKEIDRPAFFLEVSVKINQDEYPNFIYTGIFNKLNTLISYILESPD